MQAHANGKIGDLAEMIERLSGTDGAHATPIPRVFLHRSSHTGEPIHGVYEPAVCIMAQGSKQADTGQALLRYTVGQYLIISVGVPVVSQLTEATPERPYLCLRIDLDPAAIGAILLDADMQRAARDQPGPALAVSDADDGLLDACLRLLRLVDTPRDIPILSPLAEREILYRLLRGDQASRMAQIAFGESKLQQVNRAIGWITRNFREPFSMAALADEARMSASSLHHHFKAVTAMSPLQYQKRLRLQEARRLILAASIDAAAAGHAVGYDSPSQFSREYRRLFGAPPLRDAERVRSLGGGDIAA
jgi:AraC-like DNA-binding protein